MKTTIPSFDQIKRGLKIYEQIEQLQKELANVFGVKSADKAAKILSDAGWSRPSGKRRGRPPGNVQLGKRGRKKAEGAQKVDSKNEEGSVPVKKRGRKPESGATAKKAKRTISQAHREAIAAAQKKRWAAAKGE